MYLIWFFLIRMEMNTITTELKILVFKLHSYRSREISSNSWYKDRILHFWWAVPSDVLWPAWHTWHCEQTPWWWQRTSWASAWSWWWCCWPAAAAGWMVKSHLGWVSLVMSLAAQTWTLKAEVPVSKGMILWTMEYNIKSSAMNSCIQNIPSMFTLCFWYSYDKRDALLCFKGLE